MLLFILAGRVLDALGFVLVVEAVFYKFCQGLDGLRSVGSLGFENQLGALRGAEREQVDNASRVDSLIVAHERDARLELLRGANEQLRGARMQTFRVAYDDDTRNGRILHE